MTAQPLPRQTFESRIGLVPGTLLLVELPTPPRQAGFLESEECFESSRALLQTHLDSGVLVARHGGRILAVWFPGASADDARKEFERLQVELPGPISAGGTVATGGEEAAVLLDRADRALSRAQEDRGWAEWDPQLDRGRRRADPLAGILSAEPARTYRNVRSLLEAIEAVALAVRLEEMLPRALQRIIEVAGVERGLILLARSDGSFETAVARDRSGRAIEMEDDRSRSIPRRVFEDGVSVCLTRIERSAGTEVVPSSLDTHSLRTVLCVPLEAGGRRMGVVYADGRVHSDMVGTEDLSFLEAMARQLAAAIESARIVDKERRRIEEEVTSLRASEGGRGLVGEHPTMRVLFEQIAHLGPRRLNVLITGPTGSGKELVARALHASSDRREGPFQVLDCGALSTQLLESELFGHERGAFTGALEMRPGIFEQTHGGTLLLDEASLLPPKAQAYLLRVLEEGLLRRVGGQNPIPVQVRILASTRFDLREAVATGQFREDLLYRLAGVEIEVPPLARRGEDVLLIATHFLRLFGEARPLSQEARRALLVHDWPGNVRELRHRLLRGSTLAEEPVLTTSDLGLTLTGTSNTSLQLARESARQAVDTEFVRKALAHQGGNASRAADALGISRARLYQMMKKLEIEPGEYRS